MTEITLNTVKKNYNFYSPGVPFTLQYDYPITTTEIDIRVFLKLDPSEDLFVNELEFNQASLKCLFLLDDILVEIKNTTKDWYLLKSIYYLLACINTFFSHFNVLVEIIDNQAVYLPKFQKIFEIYQVNIIPYYLAQYFYKCSEILNIALNNGDVVFTKERVPHILCSIQRKIFNIMFKKQLYSYHLENYMNNFFNANGFLLQINSSSSTLLEKTATIKKYLLNKYPDLLDKNTIVNYGEVILNFLITLIIYYKEFLKNFSKYILDLSNASCLSIEHNFFYFFLNEEYKNDPLLIANYYYIKQQQKIAFKKKYNKI